MKNLKAIFRNLRMKKLMFSFPKKILHSRILQAVIDRIKRLKLGRKLLYLITFMTSLGSYQYLYILFFLPISVLTFISSIILIEGQLFHLLNETRCAINSFQLLDEYCSSYFGLMLGILMIGLLQLYLFWHFVTTVRNRLFSNVIRDLVS